MLYTAQEAGILAQPIGFTPQVGLADPQPFIDQVRDGQLVQMD